MGADNHETALLLRNIALREQADQEHLEQADQAHGSLGLFIKLVVGIVNIGILIIFGALWMRSVSYRKALRNVKLGYKAKCD